MTFVEAEDGSEVAEETGEGEWVEDDSSDRVLMRMVGDDHDLEVSEGDCSPLSEDDLCWECGQIGCSAARC